MTQLPLRLYHAFRDNVNNFCHLTVSLLPLSHGRLPPHAASFSSINGFVLKLLLHVYMGSKCSSSLYEAFQMEDKSCKGPIYICRTSFYLLTEVKLGMIKLKTFLVHTQARFTRTTLANPGCFNFFSSFSLLSSSCANSAFLHSGLSIFPFSRSFSSWLASGFSLLAWLCCQLLFFSLVFLILVH